MLLFLMDLLNCAVSMTVITLIYLAMEPFFIRHYRVKWLYYGGLVLVIGWLIPIRLHLNQVLLQTVNLPSLLTLGQGAGTNAFPEISDGQLLDFAVNEAAEIPPMFFHQAMIGIWVIGMMITGMYHLWRHRQFIKTVFRWAEHVTEQHILDELEQTKEQLNIQTEVSIKTCPLVAAPMILGFFRPMILLPSSSFDTDDLSSILGHELIHLKRKDLWYKALVLLVTIIHWFNPIVHLMSRAIAVQCELACDERLLYGKSLEQRQQYGKLMIRMMKEEVKNRTALTNHFYGGEKAMKRRILFTGQSKVLHKKTTLASHFMVS